MTYILEKIVKELNLPKELTVVTPPPEVKFDLAIPAFKNNPEKLAKKILDLKLPYIDKVEVVGGYVNLRVNKNILTKELLTEIFKLKDKYGFRFDSLKTRPKVLIEYSSPNIAKPLHIGHLRNTILGMALKNIYQANGYKVITENWLGDWGKQYGLLILGYKKWPTMTKGGITTANLFKIYLKASGLAEKNKKFDEEARLIFQKLEGGWIKGLRRTDKEGKDYLKLWKKFRDVSIGDFKKVYKILGADFDLWTGESFYINQMTETINESLKKGVAKKDGLAVIVDLEKYQLKSYLLVKSDGASLYSARDLATAKYRFKKYNPDRIVYVIGSEQGFYLKQIFKTMELMSYKANKLKHVSYGLVTYSGKKMSSRKGNIITLDKIINEAKKKTGNIGLGALIYNILNQTNESNIIFNWKTALNLKGNSAPYIQYGYVRTQSILKKAGVNTRTLRAPLKIDDVDELEEELVIRLARFPEVIKRAQETNQPHFIANYLNDLTQSFSRFYEQYPILKADAEKRALRLRLAAATGQVLKNGLTLLGIKMPKKM